MTRILHETFEGGSNAAECTTSNTASDLVTNHNSYFTNAWKIEGSLACDISTTNAIGSLRFPLGSAQDVVATVFYFRLVGSNPSSNIVIANVRSGSTIYAEARILSNSTLQIRDRGSAKWTSSSGVPTDTDLRLEWLVNSGAGTQEINLYNKHDTSARSGFASGSQTYTTGTMDTTTLGVITSATAHLRIDAYSIYNSASDLPAPEASPPSITIGDQTIQDYHSASLTPTVTGNTGTTTYAWSVVSGPSTSSGQFSTTSAKDTTFTPAGGGGSYVLRLSVTDDSGTTTKDATITVTALLTADTVASVTTSTGWTASAGTVLACLSDNDSGTTVTTSNNPTSLDLKVTMRGIVPPTGNLKVNLRDLWRSGGTGTVDVSLYKPDGATLVKKISGTVAPTTAADTAVTFLAADISGVAAADWRSGVVLLIEATGS